jgi:hypothetical protein
MDWRERRRFENHEDAAPDQLREDGYAAEKPKLPTPSKTARQILSLHIPKPIHYQSREKKPASRSTNESEASS